MKAEGAITTTSVASHRSLSFMQQTLPYPRVVGWLFFSPETLPGRLRAGKRRQSKKVSNEENPTDGVLRLPRRTPPTEKRNVKNGPRSRRKLFKLLQDKKNVERP